MNELKRHKKSDKIKWIITATCIVLLFVMVAGLCMQMFVKDDKYKPSEWFKPDTEQTQPEKENEIETATCAVSNYKAKTMTTEAVATSNETWSSLGVTLSESEVTNLQVVLGDFFAYIGSTTDSVSSAIVKNNINDTELTGVLAIQNEFGSAMFVTMCIILLPKYNVFEDLPHYGFENVVLKYKGEVVNVNTAHTNYYPKDFNLYMFPLTSLNPTVLGSNLSIEYSLVEVEKPIPLPPNPVKEGYTFVGWYFDEAFTQKYDGSPIYSDTRLYAKFEINRYAVVFNTDGGNTVENQIVEWNKSATLTTPTREGYIFKGWFMSNGTEYTNQPIKENITLTARWEIIMCTVTFYVDGEVYATKSVEYGTSLIKMVESASELNLIVTAVRSANGDIDSTILTNAVVTDNSLEFVSEVLTGTDKVINTVNRNKWQIVGGVVGGVALIAVVAGIVGGTKPRKR